MERNTLDVLIRGFLSQFIPVSVRAKESIAKRWPHHRPSVDSYTVTVCEEHFCESNEALLYFTLLRAYPANANAPRSESNEVFDCDLWIRHRQTFFTHACFDGRAAEDAHGESALNVSISATLRGRRHARAAGAVPTIRRWPSALRRLRAPRRGALAHPDGKGLSKQTKEEEPYTSEHGVKKLFEKYDEDVTTT